MITASFNKYVDTREIHHIVKGHAGQADIGKDIICSAASILTQTLAQIVYDHKHKLVGKPIIKLESGYSLIHCICKDRQTFYDMVQAVEFAEKGYELLAHNHPQYVELKSFFSE